MAYANGQIPLSALQRLSWVGHYLRSDAASAFERLNTAYRARFGVNISVTDAYRTLASQFALKASWTARGRPNMAATPGKSNHGWGLAVDLGGGINSFYTAQWNWMIANGPAYGWVHRRWHKPGTSTPEPWHFEFDQASQVSNPIGGTGSVSTPNVPGAPAPIEENDMTPNESKMLADIHRLLGAGKALESIPDDRSDLTISARVADIHGAIGAGNGASTPENSTVLANVRASNTKLTSVPNDVWMYPLVGRRDGVAEVHPAVEWLSVLCYRVSDLVSAPPGSGQAVTDPDEFAKAIVEALPDDIAQAVIDGLAKRLEA